MSDDKTRNPESQVARLSYQFIRDNRGLLRDYGVSVESKFDGKSVSLSFKTTNFIGALPLLSPFFWKNRLWFNN